MITTDRNEFLGAHVTPAVKDALKEEAKKEDLSVSMLVFKLLKLSLRAKGYNVELTS